MEFLLGSYCLCHHTQLLEVAHIPRYMVLSLHLHSQQTPTGPSLTVYHSKHLFLVVPHWLGRTFLWTLGSPGLLSHLNSLSITNSYLPRDEPSHRSGPGILQPNIPATEATQEEAAHSVTGWRGTIPQCSVSVLQLTELPQKSFLF